MSFVRLYTKPGCMGCKLVLKELRKAGIEPEIIDIMADDEAYAHLQRLGALGVPVVESSVMPPILGFKRDEIAELIALFPKPAA